MIEGAVQVEHNGICFESFFVQINLTDGYPLESPKVFEVGGRIPRNSEHHINPDGSLCLGVPEELWLEMQGHFEIGAFIEHLLTPFLIGVSEKLRTGQWPGPERPHGAAAICEFYGAYIGCSSPPQVMELLQLLLQKKELKGHWLCPCGSGQILRRCHGQLVRTLASKGLPPQIVAKSIKYLELEAAQAS
ncbi:MAG: hypothetical protein WBX25_03460 [Rhodomicrobium sp.]